METREEEEKKKEFYLGVPVCACVQPAFPHNERRKTAAAAAASVSRYHSSSHSGTCIDYGTRFNRAILLLSSLSLTLLLTHLRRTCAIVLLRKHDDNDKFR